MEKVYIVFVRNSIADEHWEAICACDTEEGAFSIVDWEVEETGNDRSNYWVNAVDFYMTPQLNYVEL